MEAAEPFDFSNTSNTLISSNDAPNFTRYPFVFGFKTKWTENHHDIGIASLIRRLRPPVVGLKKMSHRTAHRTPYTASRRS